MDMGEERPYDDKGDDFMGEEGIATPSYLPRVTAATSRSQLAEDEGLMRRFGEGGERLKPVKLRSTSSWF